MSISEQKWTRVKAIVMDAMELPTRERADFVAEVSADDIEVHQEAAALLAADVEVRGNARLWEPPRATDEGVALPDPGGSMLVGKRLGRYVIARLIGMGGMGAVYEARQDGLSRPVALKVLRAGLISGTARVRFQREAELLARLEHAGIGRIYDSGVHESEFGPIPYFVMELISDAAAITDYARTAEMSIRERVAMFAGVCDAVHYGHQRGVIHRDLKPSNILVGRTGVAQSDEKSGRELDESSSKVVVKVIDFGIARSTDADVTLATVSAAGDVMLGTLAYMSPEQCALDPAEIDTRCDVYALGVVLYELLTGRLPYEVTGKPLHEAARVIQHDLPQRPTAIVPRLSGDLSVILLKTLAKDRRQRYDSAAEMGADLRRWLGSLPILARPASRAYQIRMFVRRYRPLVLAAGAVSAAVVAGLVGTSIALGHALRERDRAREAEVRASDQRTRAENVATFLRGVLRETSAPVLVSQIADARISPIASSVGGDARRWGGQSHPASLQDVVKNVRKGLEGGAMADKALAAELRLVTLQLLITRPGTSKENAEIFRTSPDELRQAAVILGQTDKSVLATGIALSAMMVGSGQVDEAVEMLQPLYRAAVSEFGPGDLRSLELGRQLVWNMTQPQRGAERFTLAETLVREATLAHGDKARVTLACWLQQASVLSPTEPRRAGVIGRQVLKNLGPDVAEDDELLPVALDMSVADWPRVPANRQTLLDLAAVQRRVCQSVRLISGGDARRTFDSVGGLLNTLLQLGDYVGAADAMREVMDESLRMHGTAYHVTTKSQSRVARLLVWGGGDLEEALWLATTAYENGVAASGAPLGDYELFDWATLLDVRRARGEAAAALSGIDVIIRDYRAVSGGHLSWFGAYAEGVAAQSLTALGRIDEARARWRLALIELGEKDAQVGSIRIVTLRLGTAFFERYGPEETAAQWRAKLVPLVAVRSQ